MIFDIVAALVIFYYGLPLLIRIVDWFFNTLVDLIWEHWILGVSMGVVILLVVLFG